MLDALFEIPEGSDDEFEDGDFDLLDNFEAAIPKDLNVDMVGINLPAVDENVMYIIEVYQNGPIVINVPHDHSVINNDISMRLSEPSNSNAHNSSKNS